MSPRVKPDKQETYVVYYRASTESQKDGLGLDSQKTAINTFISRYGGEVIEEFEEIVSGGAFDRGGFNRALDLVVDTDSTLLVHRIDRLSRSGFITMALLEERNIPFIEADAPNDSAFSKGIKFLVAKDERDKTQKRVTDALFEIKENIKEKGFHISKAGNRITSLGNPGHLTEEGRRKSMKTRKNRALENNNNKRAIAVINMMKEKPLNKIVVFLNENNFYTSTGKEFFPQSVKNLIKLYE